MKKIFLIIVILVLTPFLSGCNCTYNVSNNEYNYLHDFREYQNKRYNPIIVNNVEDMKQFLGLETYSNSQNYEMLEEYDDSFFKTKSLIIVHIITTSGGDYYKIKSYQIINNEIILNVKLVNRGITCDIGQRFMILEISNAKIKNVEKINFELEK